MIETLIQRSWTRDFKKKTVLKLPWFTVRSKCLLRKEQGVGSKLNFPSLWTFLQMLNYQICLVVKMTF